MPQLPHRSRTWGGSGAWCWDLLRPLLTAESIAVDLPPASIRGGPDRLTNVPDMGDITLRTWADSVLAEADDAGFDRFVLVGHSLGGLSLTAVASLAPDRIVRLVFITAVVPPEGGTVMDILPDDVMADMAAGLTEDVVRRRFCTTSMRPQRVRARPCRRELIGNVDRTSIPSSVPTTYIRALNDRYLHRATQDDCIDNLRGSPGLAVQVIDIESGHFVILDHPDEVAQTLNSAESAM